MTDSRNDGKNWENMKIKKYEYFDVCYDLKKQYYFKIQFYFTINNKKSSIKWFQRINTGFSMLLILNQDRNLDEH